MTNRRPPVLLRLVSGSFWTFGGAGFSSAASVVAAVLCSRALGRTDFGRLNAIATTVGLFALVAGLGLGLTATRFIAEHRDSDRERVGRILGMLEILMSITCLVAAAVLLAGGGWMARVFFADASLAPLLRLGSLWLVGFVHNEVEAAALAGFEDFTSTAVAQFVRGVVLLVGTIVGIHYAGLTGAVAALAGSVLFSGVVLHVRLARVLKGHGIRKAHAAGLCEIRILREYSVPSLISGMALVPFVFFANGFLARSAGMSALGVVNAITQWRGAMTFLPVNLAKVAVPLLASAHHAENPEGDHLVITNWANQVLLWPVALYLLFGARHILGFNGRSFADGVPALQIMVGGTALGYVGNVIGAMICARGWFGILAMGNLLTGAAIALTTWTMGARIGAEAMSWGYCAGYALNLFLTGLLVVRALPSARLVWRKVMFAAAMMAACMVAAWMTGGDCSPLVCVLIATGAFCFAAVFFAPTAAPQRIHEAMAGFPLLRSFGRTA